MNATERLEAWNDLASEKAAAAILPCNGSRAWARRVTAQRPFLTAEMLFTAGDAIWAGLSPPEWQEAFDSHPRLGEAEAAGATVQSLHWSQGEQAAASPDEAARAALRHGNQAYEEKFGRIFIVCATGKSAAEMLAILKQRMENDADTEMRAAAEEQRKITQLRLRKWLGMSAPLLAAAKKEIRSA